ncbi:mRNA-degrading endonuclease [Candidatus Gracilibacteria bacterium CG17_big_fil_post_rev_8_21_14_2_50_48_13]|nr:MAG: mRNA-degrading endonuclease [Candidatus Gracilibacteria bacterium CG17_big_fil_post_rev_8_21_14_2_50_48_13]
MAIKFPQQGDILLLNFSPTRGSEQRGKRPALVISPTIYNQKTGLMLACPITTKQKGYPFELTLPKSCSVHGVVLLDQIRSIDWKTRGFSTQDTVPHAWLQKASKLLNLLLP